MEYLVCMVDHGRRVYDSYFAAKYPVHPAARAPAGRD